ncbi:MAG: hypothetical protein FWD61_14995, partial [Phycisphaerales bacterium]|nr:hypothetical protein [Phycisphaerales bacterium]
CHDEAYAAFTQKYRHTTAARRYTVTSMCHEFQKKQVFFIFFIFQNVVLLRRPFSRCCVDATSITGVVFPQRCPHHD